MKRIVVIARVVSLLALVGILAVAPVPVGSVAYAEHTNENVLLQELAKIKKMVSDMETEIKAKKMTMGAKGMDKAMDMLTDIEKILKDIRPRMSEN